MQPARPDSPHPTLHLSPHTDSHTRHPTHNPDQRRRRQAACLSGSKMNNHPQAPQGNPPYTCCEVTPDQPQSAIMAATYHTGGTMIQPPQYQNFPGNDETVPSRLGPSWHRPYHNPDDWHAPIAPPPALLQQRRGSPANRGTSEEYASFEPSQYPYVASQSFRSDSRGWIDAWRDGPRSAVQDSDAQSHATMPHLHQSSAYQHHHSGSEYPSYSNQSDHVLRAFQHLEIRNPSVSIVHLMCLSMR